MLFSRAPVRQLTVALLVMATIYVVLNKRFDTVNDLPFAFVRTDVNKRGLDCDLLLFNSTPAKDFTLSADYRTLRPVFDEIVRQSGFVEVAEGHWGRLAVQARALHYLASRRSVHTVCETGFNAGHNAFNYLTASHRLVVHSFDIGQHAYTARIAANLSSDRRMFPARLFLHVGDSTKTVPQFIADNPRVRCSMIVIDGGHSYPVAMSDAVHLSSIAEDGAVIVFDDYPSPGSQGDAWDECVRRGCIQETGHCTFQPQEPLAFAPGFAFGTIVKRFKR